MKIRCNEHQIIEHQASNVKVIPKKEGDLIWYNINSKIYGTIYNTNEIIQHYFNNLENTQLCAVEEKNQEDSADDDNGSFRDYYSDSKDSICLKMMIFMIMILMVHINDYIFIK